MSFANRGTAFENLINDCNLLYRQHKIALVTKRPTPVKILGVDGRGRVRGFLEKPSEADYDGFYKQRGLAFEAKSIAAGERFPLSNLEQHQFEYLSDAHYVGNVPSFLLIEFTEHRVVYLLPFTELEQVWKMRSKVRGSKSIHISYLERYGYPVAQGRGVPCDYLAVIDHIWEPPA
ncbi:Holliday junction resolvase RecU [Cohnella sp. GbtcB17]|uniref:Holliday junction resolvase RecU n=1 Tax=Cohnella sp. GbtcB17 TaxID=2824762 RepID=UPI001C2F3762|nr:Holliday junction resolvase RecU [Cohnella sp. GbtcB17]